MYWYVDLYGRGYSDAPQTTYDSNLYITQLALLMQHVRWDNAHMVGVSMVRLVPKKLCLLLRKSGANLYISRANEL